MWDIYQASFTGENVLHVTFPVIIGFDLLPFQNFGDFLSCVLRDFKLYIHVSPDALVWCSVNPSESIKQMAEVYPFTENTVSDIYQMNAVPKIAGYEGVDILLKPRLHKLYLQIISK
jgi:hypothetical protein